MSTKPKGRVVQCPAAFSVPATAGESLFGLTTTYLAAQQRLLEIDLDPQTIADTLESLEGDVAVKSLRVIAIAQQYDAFAKAILDRMAAMSKRAAGALSQAETLRTYVLTSLKAAGFEGGDKIESPEISLRLQNNPPKVLIEDEAAVPKFYWRTPERPPQPPDVIDKKALLEDLKADANGAGGANGVPGARLVVETRLVER